MHYLAVKIIQRQYVSWLLLYLLIIAFLLLQIVVRFTLSDSAISILDMPDIYEESVSYSAGVKCIALISASTAV